MTKNFEKNSFSKRVKTMLRVDFRRMFTTPFFYIVLGIALVVPILILVMTTMMEGSPMTDSTGAPLLDEFGNPMLMEGFDNVWQMIGSLSNHNPQAGMDIVSMCNINLVFFMSCVLVCVFIAEDFRSGYCKNLFTVRAKKTDYVFSKTLTCFIGSALLLIAFFIGATLGGAICKLPFTMAGFHGGQLALCVLAKICLLLVFVAIYTAMGILAKQRTWLSILLSLGVGMLLFMMIPTLTPLNANFLHVILCLAGGTVFAIGLGAVSRALLIKRDIL